MTFLNPIALLGLIAAAIPLLLHIFNLRKLKTIEFSTLAFLKELQKTKIHRLKLRQLLLLILRTLLVVLIVFTFARPTLKGYIPGGLAERAKTTAVIIFDDSQSMTGSDEDGELLHQAKNTAISITNLIKEGDEIFLLKLSDVPIGVAVDIPSAQRNISVIQNAINEIKPSSIHRTIEDAIRFTARLLAASNNFNREVYVISDFQSGSFESKTNISRTAEQLFAPATQFFLITLGKRKIHNIAIESIEIPNTIFELNKPFIVKAKITNHSISDVHNHVICAYQDGQRIAQKGVDIQSGQAIETEFTLFSKHSGYIEGTVELEDDDLEFDNKRYFTVHIPEQLRVLLVGDGSDLSYIRLALLTRLSDSSANLKITEIAWNRFSSTQLNDADVVILSNPQEITSNQSSSLKTYLQNGGGAFIIPGDQTNSNSFNTNLAVPLNISVISQSDNQSSRAHSDISSVEFDKVDLRHPLFAGMFNETESTQSMARTRGQRVLESPRINTSLQFLSNPHSHSIITLTNGHPFLIEERIGNGRALLLSVAANTKWSDLPMKGLFVPLLHRGLAYLAQDDNSDHSLLVGSETSSRLPASAPLKITLIKPGGIDEFVNAQQLAAEKRIHFTDIDESGIYTLKAGNLIFDKFAANIDADESNTITVNEDRRNKVLEQLGITSTMLHTADQTQNMNRMITESRLGAELWKYFSLAALIIAIIEMLVARGKKRSFVSAANKIIARENTND